MPLTLYGQQGCPDPFAINFNTGASINDGSCVYELTNYSMENITDLSNPTLNENSGIVFFDDHIWAINDGGNSNTIYQLDTLGTIIREISISNAQNVDWEALSQNDQSLFIGDFGNNSGSRQDLSIYVIDKAEIQNPLISSVNAVKRTFVYEDQVEFLWGSNAHNYDCEAFISLDDSLYLFSKNWLNEQTKMYALPVSWTDTATAVLKSSFDVNGLITDASVDINTGRLVLLGYKNNGANLYSSFVWMIWDYEENNFFTGNKRRIEIGSMFTLAQTEGIALINSARGFVSSEQISSIVTIPPKLLKFDFSDYFFEQTMQAPSETPDEIRVYPNPGGQKIIITASKGDFFIYESPSLRLVLKGELESNQIDVSKLGSGAYFLKIGDYIVTFIKSK